MNRRSLCAPLLRLAVCLVAGILLGDAVSIPAALPVVLLLASVGLAVVLRSSPAAQSVVLGVGFLVLGMAVAVHQRQRLSASWPTSDVVCEAVVVSEPRLGPKSVVADVLVCSVPTEHLPAADSLLATTLTGRKVRCYAVPDAAGRALTVGDGLRFQTRFQPLRERRFGTFDYRRYLEVHGVTATAYVGSARPVATTSHGPRWQRCEVSLEGLSQLSRVQLFFMQQRHRMLHRLRLQGLGDEAYGVVAAMALGDKSALSAELKTVYQLSGASHVLALSGLHLGIVYCLLSFLVAGRRRRTVWQAVVVLGMWGFAFLVGLSVSVVRAALMFSLYCLLSLGQRGRAPVNVLSLAAIVLLLANPLSVYDVGFQLSFLSMLSILLVVPLSDDIFPPGYLQAHRIVNWFWGLCVVSIAAQVGTAPLVAYYFGRLPVLFLLTNLVVVPAATVVLYLTLLVCVLPFVPWLGPLLGWLVGALNTVLSTVSAWPCATIGNLHPTALQVAMIYVVIGASFLLLSRLRSTSRSRFHH